MKVLKRVLIWIWCFPQMLAGFLVKVFTRAEKSSGYYKYNITLGSVSLGEYIFLCPSHCGDDTVLKHEQGHCKQSLYLGWLYLIIIGIPSVIWAGCFQWYRRKHNISYYSFYTERWADRLGGVIRY